MDFLIKVSVNTMDHKNFLKFLLKFDKRKAKRKNQLILELK